jgi:hypothetical protein
MAWYTGGILNNPAANTILADTGAVPGGDQKVILGADVATVCTVEWRNAANTANNAAQVIAVPANQSMDFDFRGIPFATGERLRVRLNTTIVGNCQVSILTL